jgi:ubiquinone/menaquinone biosynthesis C-methylase UbiE
LEPRAIGSPPGAYKIALEFLSKVGVKKVLDCPAGEGLFARILLENKFDVYCSDICPEQFKLQGISCDFSDLNASLPYDDGSFDAVTCLNGLQRVWARGRAVRELARVVKPGGYVIISFPNNADIRRRLLFMMTGSVTWNVIGPPHVCLPEAENPGAFFRYPMTLANVLSAIASVGLECEAIRPTHYTKAAILLSPLIVGPKLFSLFSPKRYRDLYEMKRTSTLGALLGAFLVVFAKKPTDGKS